MQDYILLGPSPSGNTGANNRLHSTTTFRVFPPRDHCDKPGSVSLTIVFAMLSETGHYHGSFRLAKALRERGHKVCYTGLIDFADLVRQQGFSFTPIAAELLPKGYLAAWVDQQSSRAKRRFTRQDREDRLVFRRFMELIDNGGLDEVLLAVQPDVLVCDTLTWYLALRAYRLRIPTIHLNTTLSFHPNTHIPPVLFTMGPGETRFSHAVTLLAWKYLGVKFFFTKRLASKLFGAYRYPNRMHHLSTEFRRIAARAGYPLKRGVTYHMSETGPMLTLEQIVLCPKVFNFPYAPNEPKRVHLGAFIDLERSENPLPDETLDESKPLVVCSLGTNAFYYPHAPRFFKCVFQASRRAPHWQFVLHLVDPALTRELGIPPENLLVRSRIPQLSLLRRAAVMVNHGGMNSIMECVHFDVPMVILPGLRDQPGAAARARYHELALLESMATITPDKLISRIQQAMDDRRIRQGLARMRSMMERDEGLAEAVMEVERAGTRAEPEQPA